ncbi:hypothetical protein [Marinobacter sp.]|uniref:helix-turn-helix transcriptional regulator n=1 Tax=Marinobacter sp. TaxID=50741 RepID=UPI002B471A83|nr:hypothetical protein [Marinobacter sp.]HKK55859.1 hypothetical protein [Marinobacter sp.]
MKHLDSAAPALLEDLYECTTDTGQWPAFLTKFANLFDSETAVLRLTDRHNPVIYHSYTTGFREDINNLYESEAVEADPFREGLATTPIGQALTSDQVIKDRDFERCVHYQNVFRPNGNFYALGSQFERDRNQAMHVGVHRPRPAGPYTPEECRVLEFLTPHLRRAIRLSRLVMELNQSLAQTQHALDRLSFSVWQMDAMLRLTWLNRSAEEIFADGAYGFSLQTNRLTSNSPGTASRLRMMMTRLLEHRSYTETLRISRNGACLIMTLCSRADMTTRVGRSGVPGILCFVLDPDLPVRLDHTQLQVIYQLTPAELRLASLLVSGLDVAEASALLQISKHTGRTQLKSIMNKTGVNRQAALQRKLLVCAGTLRNQGD